MLTGPVQQSGPTVPGGHVYVLGLGLALEPSIGTMADASATDAMMPIAVARRSAERILNERLEREGKRDFGTVK